MDKIVIYCKSYLNDNKFSEKNIKVSYQEKLNKKHVLEIL